ncbi:AbrB family transcriptional regulator [Devosia sp. MC532]|uniref:AbrB family transcriptional regulator n=1 Tax=Devosia sp. MC532 TaxID=2799788 RepID=UPI0018F71ECB|nr:AbrB family transcriptional regulator [Devosia sp. MC532]MBJ7577474.1 AbrB family transcriptional regulator [Devosia sp. MC532]
MSATASLSAARSGVLTLATLLIAILGGVSAELIGFPAGWLMGSAISVSIAAMLKLPVTVPDWLRDLIFVFIGVSMGASVAPNSLELLGQWPVSLAALALELIIIVLVTGWLLTKLFKLDAGTAYLSSFPGHLSFVLGIAATGIGNARQIVIIQVMRVLFLTIAVPIGAMFLPVQAPDLAAARDPLSIAQILLLALCCALVGLVFVKLKIPAGMVLGAMAAATIAKLGGAYSQPLPDPLVVTIFILTGALIGSRFIGITWLEFKAAALGGVIATAVMLVIVTAMAYGVAQLVDIPMAQIWLALSPGALEGVGALAIAMGYDTAFIAAHHVIRLLLLSFAIPTVALFIRRLEAKEKGH